MKLSKLLLIQFILFILLSYNISQNNVHKDITGKEKKENEIKNNIHNIQNIQNIINNNNQNNQNNQISDIDDMPLTVHLNDPHLTSEEIKIGLDAKAHGASAMWFEHKKHKHLLILGPEHPPHGAVFLTLFVCMIGLQLGIFYWKNKYPSSYQKVTLVGLLVIPPIISFASHFYRFLIIWLIFCIITAYLVYRATRVPLEPTVPKMIYLWFDGLYRFFYGMSVVGYVIFMLDIFGLDLLLPFVYLFYYIIIFIFRLYPGVYIFYFMDYILVL